MKTCLRFLPRITCRAALILLIAFPLPFSASAEIPQPLLADPPRVLEGQSRLPVDFAGPTPLNALAVCSPGSFCVYLPLTLNSPLDPRSRQFVVDLFNSAYLASSGVPSGWNGNVASCVPGTTTQAFRDSVLLHLNYFREMAGLSKLTGFNPE